MTEARMFLQFLADFDSLFRQVNLVGEANQHGTFAGKDGACGFLALVVGQGVIVGKAQDFDYDESPTAHRRVTNLGDPRHRAGKFFFGRSRTYMCGRAIFWGQSAAHTLAAHLPEPSLASRVLSPRGHYP